MDDRLLGDIDLDGVERVLVLCPTDTTFLCLIRDLGHDGPTLVADYDAARLRRIAHEWGEGELPDRYITWNVLVVAPPPSGAQPQAAFLDLDSAPSKTAAIHLVRTLAGWTAGPVHLLGSRSLGMESTLRDATDEGGLQQLGHRWRKGKGLATLRALFPNTGRPPPTRLTYREVCERRLILETDVFTFAGGEVDPASDMLADAVELEGDERVLDLGCGAGVVGLALAAYLPRGEVVMSDSNLCSVAVARRNQLRNGASNVSVLSAIGADGYREGAFDVVALNPPFHEGRLEDHEVGRQLVEGAFAACRIGGRVYVVASRFLPYEKAMSAHGETEQVAGDRSFKVLRTTRAR
jgi:16S rRNA G1207 methylase RsmC